MRPRRRTTAPIALLVALAAPACVSSTTRPRPLSTGTPIAVSSPVRAYLLDGSIVVYPGGISVESGVIRGPGMRYGPTLTDSAAAGPVPLDSIIGVEALERTVNPGRTLLYSAMTAAGVGVGAAAMAVAIFGSCPTIYSDSAGTAVLEAESYSYSIAPLLEERDVDLLRVAADAAGIVHLEVRNEALETHYTDLTELLEVRHARDERALPLPDGGVAAVRALAAPVSARDGAGRDVRAVVERADDRIFATDDELLRRAAEGEEARDHIDLAFLRPAGTDTVTLALRLRSSLLATVLLYDHMLARPGARSLDWMARDLGRIGTLVELAEWYRANFGLRVAVLQDGSYREVARIANVGPAAWHETAVFLPTHGADSVHVRLSFLADEWRIDRVALAGASRRPAHRRIPAARVADGAGGSRPDVRDVLAATDGRRLETRPGQRYFIEFDAGLGAPDEERTFLLASQGYYAEWVRGAWLATPSDSAAFSPSPASLPAVLTDWRARKDSLERHFFERRVPIAPEVR